MLDNRGSFSSQSTLNIQKLHGWHWPNNHPSLRERDLLDHRTAAGQPTEQGHIAQWLDDTRSALLRSAPDTPPPEMDTLSANTMLMPRYGGLANISSGVKPALYQTNGGFYGDKSLAQALNHSTNKASIRNSSPDRWNDREFPENLQRRGSDEPIASYLQIPRSINDSKGSLSEFAAQVSFKQNILHDIPKLTLTRLPVFFGSSRL